MSHFISISVLASFLLFYLPSQAQDEEIKCDELIAKSALGKATQNLETSIRNNYPNLEFNCEPNKGYAPFNFQIVNKKIKIEKGPSLEFFKGSAVCTMVDKRIVQKTKTDYNITINKENCSVMGVTQNQSKTNYSYK